LVLALKLAELTHIEASLGEPPVLLLDDVPSELDPERRALLFRVIARLDCQTLISVTEREIVPLPDSASEIGGDQGSSTASGRRDFCVRAGRVSAQP
jgi:recombinational DNA repair ATPase RecF